MFASKFHVNILLLFEKLNSFSPFAAQLNFDVGLLHLQMHSNAIAKKHFFQFFRC